MSIHLVVENNALHVVFQFNLDTRLIFVRNICSNFFYLIHKNEFRLIISWKRKKFQPWKRNVKFDFSFGGIKKPVGIQFSVFLLPSRSKGVATFLNVTLKNTITLVFIIIKLCQFFCFVLFLKTVNLLVDGLKYCFSDFLLPSLMKEETDAMSFFGCTKTYLSEIVSEKSL